MIPLKHWTGLPWVRQQVADLLGVALADYTPHQMTYDLRWLRLKGLIYRPPKTNRYFVIPAGRSRAGPRLRVRRVRGLHLPEQNLDWKRITPFDWHIFLCHV